MITCGQCGFASEQAFTYCPTCGTHSAGSGDAGLNGRILNGKYRVLSELGSGSMGTVYLAEHVALKKKIALKVLHRELQLGDEPLQRFQREGIAAGQITHNNVIQIFDFDRTEDGTCYLAMEYVEGENLQELLLREGALTTEVALSLMRQLLQTLMEAHRQGVVHRDLKPENLMVVGGADDDVVLKVLDFGLSKLVDRPVDAGFQTMSGRVMGTPLYMAPEQWHGEEVDQRSDLYSAALILYEMLTGHQPFKGGNVTEMLMRSTTEAPPSVLDHATKHPVPVDLDPVLRRGMAKERGDRFQDAAEMLEAIDAVRLDQVQRGSATVRSRAPRKRSQGHDRSAGDPVGRDWRKLVGVSAGLLAVAALFIWLLGGNGAGSNADARLISDIPREQRSEAQQEYVASLDEARDRLRGGELAPAMAAADRAARQPMADAEAFVVRAQVYRRQRDFDTAMLDYQEAEKRWPGFAPAVAGIGWLLFDQGDLPAADARFRAAMQEDAACGVAYAGAAAVLLAQQSAAQALLLLTDDAEQVADDALVQVYRGEAQLALGQVDEALESFVKAKRGDPSMWRAYRGLAMAHDQKGNVEAAEQQCVTGLAMVKDARELRVLHAELLLGQDRFADALAALNAAGKRDGNMFVIEGVARQGLDDGKAAQAAWSKALEAGVDAPAKVHLLLAMQCAAESRWADSARHAEEAVLADDSLAKAHFHWGVAAFRLEDYPDAAFHFERAVELDGSDLLARYSLGVLYMDYLQRPADAITQLRAYVDGGGGDAKVAGWLQALQR